MDKEKPPKLGAANPDAVNSNSGTSAGASGSQPPASETGRSPSFPQTITSSGVPAPALRETPQNYPGGSVVADNGDIVIENRKTRKNKAWVIAAASMAAIILVVIAAVTAIRPNSGSLAQAFAEYRSLVVDGPVIEEIEETLAAVDEDGEEDGAGVEVSGSAGDVTGTDDAEAAEDQDVMDAWFIFDREQLLTPEGRTNYFGKLKESYGSFAEQFESSTGLEDGAKDILRQSLSAYSGTLDGVILMLGVSALEDEMLEKYLDGGHNTAVSYVGQAVPDLDEDDPRRTAYSGIQNYLVSLAAMYDVYAANSCLVDGEVDMACVSGLYDSEDQAYLSALGENNTQYDNMESAFDTLKSIFYTQTEEIYGMLGEKDV
jgi:hypothetical protein